MKSINQGEQLSTKRAICGRSRISKQREGRVRGGVQMSKRPPGKSSSGSWGQSRPVFGEPSSAHLVFKDTVQKGHGFYWGNMNECMVMWQETNLFYFNQDKKGSYLNRTRKVFPKITLQRCRGKAGGR